MQPACGTGRVLPAGRGRVPGGRHLLLLRDFYVPLTDPSAAGLADLRTLLAAGPDLVGAAL
ncbi:hypothetical protein J7F01_05890 [Streptomyces sp. ISL-22]|uniref:hypothetical protein n=1 Tax=unclassified Streptomyces TaxID=2593676 RepID=UPI001BE505EC|nr:MULTISPECIES: hypothetical protein [unclassified Streptomyces]MBT2419955.1 hypothetical protein [Streptomyces sp. ISL-24]MBT2431738.1 hypothetical protein [Streptomyces sp. ISL-22]